MFCPPRFVRYSLDSTISPIAAEARVDELNGIMNPLRRVGALALHHMVINHPSTAARMLGEEYEPLDLDPLGYGSEAAVFRLDDQSVLKIMHGSMSMTPSQRDRAAQEKECDFEALSKSLPNFTLPQATYVDAHPHPYFSHLEAIQTEQPYVAHQDLQLFNRQSIFDSAVNLRHIQKLIEERPALLDQLKEFVERSLAMNNKQGLLPDTIGGGNLVVTDHDEVLLIDGQPIPPKPHLKKIRSVIDRQLRNLDYALAHSV
jgi:hypothetical protein